MREIMASSRSYLVRVSVFLATMALLGVMATTSGAAEGNTTLVSVDSSGNQAIGENHHSSISPDGRYVAFASEGTSLVGPEEPGVFVHDRQTGTSELVSVDSSGNPADGGCCGSLYPSISADGRFVAFWSWATNLVPNDSNGKGDIFVHDRRTGTTERVSVGGSGNQANGTSYDPSISADGRFVAFGAHGTNLVANDTNREGDIFVRDRQTSTTERVSVNSSGNQANGTSAAPSISSDGRFVAFHSRANNLVANDTNDRQDIFVHDRQSGITRRVSVGSSGNQANFRSILPSISADGRFVAFNSPASNLVANDTNGSWDVFARDRQTGTTERVSVDNSGNQATGNSFHASINPDGGYVAFWSSASNLVANDTNRSADVFVRDRQRETTQRVSVDSSGNQANSYSVDPSISSDGGFVAFSSNASNLVANDINNEQRTFDVFVHERDTTAPRVTGVVPTEEATDVALDADLVATFSERMEKTTLTEANFKLYELIENPDGTTTAKQTTNVTVTPNSDGLKATLNPYGTSGGLLAKDTRYKVVVSTGALDVFGNQLDQQPSVYGNQPKVWYFKTRG